MASDLVRRNGEIVIYVGAAPVAISKQMFGWGKTFFRSMIFPFSFS